MTYVLIISRSSWR